MCSVIVCIYTYCQNPWGPRRDHNTFVEINVPENSSLHRQLRGQLWCYQWTVNMFVQQCIQALFAMFDHIGDDLVLHCVWWWLFVSNCDTHVKQSNRNVITGICDDHSVHIVILICYVMCMCLSEPARPDWDRHTWDHSTWQTVHYNITLGTSVSPTPHNMHSQSALCKHVWDCWAHLWFPWTDQ